MGARRRRALDMERARRLAAGRRRIGAYPPAGEAAVRLTPRCRRVMPATQAASAPAGGARDAGRDAGRFAGGCRLRCRCPALPPRSPAGGHVYTIGGKALQVEPRLDGRAGHLGDRGRGSGRDPRRHGPADRDDSGRERRHRAPSDRSGSRRARRPRRCCATRRRTTSISRATSCRSSRTRHRCGMRSTAPGSIALRLLRASRQSASWATTWSCRGA